MPPNATPEQLAPGHDGSVTERDPRADRIVRLAARALGAPAAALWTMSGGTLHLASWHGTGAAALRLDGPWLDVRGVALLSDVSSDPRLSAAGAPRLTLSTPAGVVSAQRVRGCALAPVNDAGGQRAGVLAVLDVEPRAWSAADGEALDDHAALLGELARDITERKRAEEAPWEANRAADAASRAKSAFLANMSHEIRTPMNAILGHTQLLQRDLALGPGRQSQLEVIRTSGEHLLSLINDVLEMSRMELGYGKVRRDSVDLWGLLDDLDRAFRGRAEVKRLSFAMTRSPDLPRHVVADEDKLRQALVNLLGNAIKFTEQGGVSVRAIVRRAELPSSRLVIEVEDTGAGIGAESLDALFRPFAQARVGILANGGAGLGLAVTQAFAQLMGGDVKVESRVGRGSVFRLDLPMEVGSGPAPAKGAPRGRAQGIAGAESSVRVLVVSSGHVHRSWMSLLLEQVGFAVRERHDGAVAPEALEEWRPHLVLIDVHAPSEAGAATRAIRSRSASHRRVIVGFTSSTFQDDSDRLVAAGADSVLRRPCHEDDLLEEIRARLGIQYTYAEPSPPERAVEIPDLLVMRESLRDLPARMVAELCAAARIADSERLTTLVARIPDQDSPVTRALHALVERYAYEQIERIFLGEGQPGPGGAP